MTGIEIVVALVIAVGLAGVLVPLLPGTGLIGLALAVWAWDTGGTTAWVLAGLGIALLLLGAVVKYLVPSRRLKESGVPLSTQLIGAAAGVVGFFVIPVVGLLIGFVAGVYAGERWRVGPRAWASTKAALRAIGLGIVIEFLAGLGATALWVGGVVAT